MSGLGFDLIDSFETGSLAPILVIVANSLYVESF